MSISRICTIWNCNPLIYCSLELISGSRLENGSLSSVLLVSSTVLLVSSTVLLVSSTVLLVSSTVLLVSSTVLLVSSMLLVSSIISSTLSTVSNQNLQFLYIPLMRSKASKLSTSMPCS